MSDHSNHTPASADVLVRASVTCNFQHATLHVLRLTFHASLSCLVIRVSYILLHNASRLTSNY